VIAQVVPRATGRAVCLAFAQALGEFGVPGEVLTDNGKQFTDRFGKGGEVLFDKICRRNGITHLLTQPSSPNQNGKVERFHGTFRPDFLTGAGPFATVQDAQSAVDAWVEQYNTDRPHQGLDPQVPVTPAERFTPVPQEHRDLIELWLPPALVAGDGNSAQAPAAGGAGPVAAEASWGGGPVELDKVVPPSGNMTLVGKQLWLGPARAGQVVHFWAGVDLIHLMVGGARIKTVRSHLSVAELARLVGEGAVPATGDAPLPPVEDGTAVEVERCVSRLGLVSLGNRQLLAGRDPRR
jgi:hypothetical protein